MTFATERAKDGTERIMWQIPAEGQSYQDGTTEIPSAMVSSGDLNTLVGFSSGGGYDLYARLQNCPSSEHLAQIAD